MQKEITRHFGVYGVCFKGSQLLVIEKNAGPYQNRYDLPGGSQLLGEGLTETLKREFLEETGYDVIDYSNSRIYDAFVKEVGNSPMVHHVMAFYDVKIDENKNRQKLPVQLQDGKNDSNGSVWIDSEGLTSENASPLVLKIKAEILGAPVLDKSLYEEWTIK